MHTVFFLNGRDARKRDILTPIGRVFRDRKPGELLRLKGFLPLRVLRHLNQDLIVRYDGECGDPSSCDGCLDAEIRSQNCLGPHCLACRRQYPGQSAFDTKGDYYIPKK